MARRGGIGGGLENVRAGPDQMLDTEQQPGEHTGGEARPDAGQQHRQPKLGGEPARECRRNVAVVELPRFWFIRHGVRLASSRRDQRALAKRYGGETQPHRELGSAAGLTVDNELRSDEIGLLAQTHEAVMIRTVYARIEADSVVLDTEFQVSCIGGLEP